MSDEQTGDEQPKQESFNDEAGNEQARNEQPADEQPKQESFKEIKNFYSGSDDPGENFYMFAKKTRKRVRRKWDAVYGITGAEGVGKSTLAYQMGKHMDDTFSMERNIIFSPDKEKVRRAIVDLPRYSVIDVDEAIKMLYKLNWYQDAQIFLNMIYALCRRENKISLLLMPRFRDFSEFFRNHRILLWIHCISRGHAILFAKHWSPFIDDPWLTRDNQRIIDKRAKRIAGLNADERASILRKSPNYVMEMAWDPMTPQEEKLYEEMRTRSGVYDDEYTTSKWERMWKERFYQLLKYCVKNKILTYPKVSDITSTPASTLRTFISETTKKKERE